MHRSHLALGLLVAASIASPAQAASAQRAVSADRSSADGGAGTPDNGGAAYGEVRPGTERNRPAGKRSPQRGRRRSASGRPVLTAFAVSRSRFYAFGTPARVKFQIDDRSDTVRVTLAVRRSGSRETIRRIDLGERATGTLHAVRLSGMEGGTALPEGAIELRLYAKDAGGKKLRSGAHASSAASVAFYWHRFPLIGSYDYGGEGARFGSGRPGHSHQGQDLTAPAGTSVVAPRGGVVQQVAFQAGGAGNYVIVDGEDEDRDYAFMHLQDGSTVVRAGQRVRTGQLLARVGSTGSSSGPHLHFEIWEGGGWYEGGRPIDPYDHLKRWDAWS